MEISISQTPHLPRSLIDESFLEKTGVAFPGDAETFILQKLLRGELSAIEAYDQVIEKFGDEKYRVVELLKSLVQDHEEAAFDLKQILRNEGVEPESDSGAWGSVVQAVITSAGLFGEAGALRTLKRGEEHGLEQYKDALEDDQVVHSRDYIRFRSIPTQQLHIDRLSAFLYLRSVDRSS